MFEATNTPHDPTSVAPTSGVNSNVTKAVQIVAHEQPHKQDIQPQGGPPSSTAAESADNQQHDKQQQQQHTDNSIVNDGVLMPPPAVAPHRGHAIHFASAFGSDVSLSAGPTPTSTTHHSHSHSHAHPHRLSPEDSAAVDAAVEIGFLLTLYNQVDADALLQTLNKEGSLHLCGSAATPRLAKLMMHRNQ